jgi:hypothetical protein
MGPVSRARQDVSPEEDKGTGDLRSLAARLCIEVWICIGLGMPRYAGMPGTSRVESACWDSPMPLPDDADMVLSALRLGWFVAEVRGRNRPDPPPGGCVDLPGLPAHALPVEIERTPKERRIQAEGVLWALADKLGVNADPDGGSTYSKEVSIQAEQLAALRAHHSDDAVTAWDTLAELVHRFDAHIQNSLSAKSDMQAYGYRLGRALAECYWALDTGIESSTEISAAAWWFLFGASRSAEMSILLGSLSAYWNPYTASAIAGSLAVWKHVAADPEWRKNAYDALFPQVRVWYELTVLGRDPTTWIRSGAHLSYTWIITKATRTFPGPIALIAVGTAALIALIVLFGSGTGSSIANTLLAIVAAAGVSAGGLSAKRFRQDLFTDLTAVAITTAPSPPAAGRSRLASLARAH